MTSRGRATASGQVGDETVATFRRSLIALLVVGFGIVGLLVGAGRLLLGTGSGPKDDGSVASPSTTTPVDLGAELPTSVPLRAEMSSINVSDGGTLADLVLGAAPGTRIAFGSFQGPLSIVDLSDGSVLELDRLRPLVLTDNYLVAQVYDVGQMPVDYALVIVNLRTLNANRVWWGDYVFDASASGEADHAWIGHATDDGTTYSLLDLDSARGPVVEIDVPVHSTLAATGYGEPYINTNSAGVYSISGETLKYVGNGVVLAASKSGEAWWRCDETLTCEVKLTATGNTQQVPNIDRLMIGGGVFALSDDGRYFAHSRPDMAGVTVFDGQTGTSTDLTTGRIWSASGLFFVGDYLIVGGELGLEVADLRTGDVHRVSGTQTGFFVDMVSRPAPPNDDG